MSLPSRDFLPAEGGKGVAHEWLMDRGSPKPVQPGLKNAYQADHGVLVWLCPVYSTQLRAHCVSGPAAQAIMQLA